jgi:hypothetical protein
MKKEIVLIPIVLMYFLCFVAIAFRILNFSFFIIWLMLTTLLGYFIFYDEIKREKGK